MMCTTMLHVGVCHRTSTPHKSGNKVKEKEGFIVIVISRISKLETNFG